MGSQWGRLLFASTAGLIEVTSNAGDCEVLLPIDPAREARFLWPQVLPLERGVLLTVSTVSDDAMQQVVDPRRVVANRKGRGGPQPAEVERMLTDHRTRLAADREWAHGSVDDFMLSQARRGQAETGVVIPTTDAEAFIRGSAEAGVLRIVA